MSVLKIKDINGNWLDIPAIKGKDGKNGEVTLEQLEKITGNLDDLSTEDKSNLVKAINEVFSKSSELEVISEGTLNLTNAKDGLYKVLADVMIKEYSSHTPYRLGTDAIFLINGKHSYKFNNYTVTYNDSSRGWTRTINFETLSKATSYDGNQNITGRYYFTTLPESSVVPTKDSQLVNKKYVDNKITTLPLYSITLADSYNADNSLISLTNDKKLELQNILQDAYNKGYSTFLLHVFGSASRLSCLLSWTNAKDLQTKPTYYYLFGYGPGQSYDRFGQGTLESIGINQLTINAEWNEETVTITSGYYIRSHEKYIATNNTNAYTPTGDYNPATKKYVDDAIATSITSVLEGEY